MQQIKTTMSAHHCIASYRNCGEYDAVFYSCQVCYQGNPQNVHHQYYIIVYMYLYVHTRTFVHTAMQKGAKYTFGCCFMPCQRRARPFFA